MDWEKINSDRKINDKWKQLKGPFIMSSPRPNIISNELKKKVINK